MNFLVVGPAVKLVFNNSILPADGIGLLATMRSIAAPLARLLGFE